MKGSLYTIGRDADYIVTKDAYVGRRHATVFLKEGQYYILNNSQNGTYVNGVRIPDDQKEYPVNDGDRIRLAKIEFEFHIVN